MSDDEEEYNFNEDRPELIEGPEDERGKKLDERLEKYNNDQLNELNQGESNILDPDPKHIINVNQININLNQNQNIISSQNQNNIPIQNQNNIFSQNKDKILSPSSSNNLNQNEELDNPYKNYFINMGDQNNQNNEVLPSQDESEINDENPSINQFSNLNNKFPKNENNISFPITSESKVFNHQNIEEQGGGNQNNIEKSKNVFKIKNKDNNDEEQSCVQGEIQMDLGEMNNQNIPNNSKNNNLKRKQKYSQKIKNSNLNNNNFMGNNFGNEFQNNNFNMNHNNNFDINQNLNNNNYNNEMNFNNKKEPNNNWNDINMNLEKGHNLNESVKSTGSNFFLLEDDTNKNENPNQNNIQNNKKINPPMNNPYHNNQNLLNNNQFQNQINNQNKFNNNPFHNQKYSQNQINNNQFQNQINNQIEIKKNPYQVKQNQKQKIIQNEESLNISSKYSINKEPNSIFNPPKNQNKKINPYKPKQKDNNPHHPGNSHNIPQNQENQHQQEIPKKSILSKKFNHATSTGLENLGGTSYLNSVLQLFGSFDGFVTYFTNPDHAKYINDNYESIPLSFVIYRLFCHLYPYPQKEGPNIYKPKYVKDILTRYSVVYKSNKERNPNDLILFTLEILHNELNKLKNNKFNEKIPNIYNKENVIKCGYHNFKNSNKSRISDLLFWFETVESRCIVCNCCTYKLLPFPLFELGIIESFAYFKKRLTIYDCLKFYEIPKKQKIFCERCKKYNDKLISSKILSPANIFIFSLNRKNLDQNLMNIPFKIDDKIDIGNFLEMKGFQSQYELIGIVSFYTAQQKYISICMSPVDNRWYIYNDESIQSTSLEIAINYHNVENSQFIPCILAYKSKKK